MPISLRMFCLASRSKLAKSKRDRGWGISCEKITILEKKFPLLLTGEFQAIPEDWPHSV